MKLPQRRQFLHLAAGAVALSTTNGLSAPAISQRAAARTLRFVPWTDLANFDPVWSSTTVARDAAALVWDMLYGIDSSLQPQRQMIEGEEVSADGLIWTFRLRPGLRFHDGEPVLAKDAVASFIRWSARDEMGLMIRAIQNELTAVDDRTFRLVLKRPYRKMLLALGKSATQACFIMPGRIAGTDPFKQINDYVGSGPMRFVKADWVPGAKAVFEKFAGYEPRQEPNSWLAGAKRMLLDRVEWVVMSDPATASAALQNGEVDWWQYPIPDLVPLLRKNRNIAVDIADALGNIGSFRMNHLIPPFNDARARRAILAAISQEDYMRAYFGDDPNLWKSSASYFTPGTPLYNEEGGEILKGPRNLDAAKKLLKDSGYSGQPVTCLVAQDVSYLKAWGEVTEDLLTRLGMNVDFVPTDWGTVVARRTQKRTGRGSWHMFHIWHPGVDCANPATNKAVRANGPDGIYGWPSSREVEEEVAAWFEAKSLDEEKGIARRLNKAAFDNVVYGPLGFFLQHQAWRKNVTGIVQGPMPFFWGVNKAA